MWNNPWHVKQAVEIIAAGGVIAYPTESVWGLGCDPWNELAVSRLLMLKQRDVSKGLILACGNINQMDFLTRYLSVDDKNTLLSIQPRPTTWLTPDLGHAIPEWIKGEHDSVAIRVSQHKLIQEITAELGYPIVSTSANPSTKAPARSALRVRQYFGDELDYIVPGQLGGVDQPSRIVDLVSGKVCRL